MKLWLILSLSISLVAQGHANSEDEKKQQMKLVEPTNLRGGKAGTVGEANDLLASEELGPEDRLLTQKKTPSIIGGITGTVRPWFVQGNGCGGTLIWKDMVLTAAHCSSAFAVGTTVYIGSTQRNALTTGAESKKVKKVITHPSYDPNSMRYDYALVQLDSLVSPTRTLATFNANKNNPADNIALTTMGYGRTSTGGSSSSSTFMEVTVTKYSDATCTTKLANIGTYYSDVMICAGDSTGKNAYKGDSGGPIVDRNDVVVGIVSWGPAPPGTPYAVVYSRVSTATSWINDNVCATTAQKSCSCTGTCGAHRKVTVKVQHDNYPQETAWSLYRIDGTAIGQQLQGSVTTPMATITKDFYLSPGIYKFAIGDSDKDGICCSYGNGYFSIMAGTKTIYTQNGQFGQGTEYIFAVGTTVSSTTSSVVVKHDDYPAETSWNLKDSFGTTLLSQVQGSVQTQGALVTKSYNLPTGGYTFNIADSDSDGICCNYGRGYFSLDVDQRAILTYRGASYGAGGSINFGVVSA